MLEDQREVCDQSSASDINGDTLGGVGRCGGRWRVGAAGAGVVRPGLQPSSAGG